MDKKDKLSERQANILTYLYEYVQEFRRPPTIREIGKATDISSTSVVNYNLAKLEEKGLLRRESEVSRGLLLTNKGRRYLAVGADLVERMVAQIPMRGAIVAGEPIEAYENQDVEDVVEVSASMLPERKEGLFALEVRGNSMVDAMVNDGDIVILKRQETAVDGDMVAAWINSEETTTLKYFFHEGKEVRLQPANPLMDPIYVPADDVSIQGKVVMVMRQT